jgi:hypothetical protein
MYVVDMEADGLWPTKIHVMSVANVLTGRVTSTTDYAKMRSFLTSQPILIGHNFSRFDVIHFERLLGIKIKAVIYDTLALSWYLYPKRNTHGLGEWGVELGVAKPVIEDWQNLKQEEYIHRCEEDVKINLLLWHRQWKYLLAIYKTEQAAIRFLRYLDKKMYAARLQEQSGWKVDLEYARKGLDEMIKVREDKVKELIQVMPARPVYATKHKPVRFHNKKGQVTKLGEAWLEFLEQQGLPPDHEEPVQYVTNYVPGNPGGSDQVKDWLFSLGWKPRTFKSVKDADGTFRDIPQVNKEAQKGGGICDSIKDLYEKEPYLELLDGLSVLNHRIPLLAGIIESCDENGRTMAKISGFTNTLRFKHKVVVNLPKPDRPWGEQIRGSFVADDGSILCGSDMASLEDRIKQHFIFPLDPDYVKSMNTEGFDPHLTVAVLAGMLTEERADAYRNGDKKDKPIRDIAKNGNYACQYGAGVPRLVITCGISIAQAAKLHKAYWQMNWAIKAVAEQQTVKELNGQMWLFNPVSGFWYSLRQRKDVFSTLVQGTASYVFDRWVDNILQKRPQLTAQFHDEIVLSIRKGAEDKCTALVQGAIDELNEELKLNRELAIDIKYAERYSLVH